MANPLFNKFNNQSSFGGDGIWNIINKYRQVQNDPGKILDVLFNNGKINQQQYNQYRQIQSDPGKILDVLLNNGKINQQQYNDLQPIRNNPQQIINYLSRNGSNANQLNQASQFANQIAGQINRGGV